MSAICHLPRCLAPKKIYWNVLDLKKKNYFSCTIGRTQANARYTLASQQNLLHFSRNSILCLRAKIYVLLHLIIRILTQLQNSVYTSKLHMPTLQVKESC